MDIDIMIIVFFHLDDKSLFKIIIKRKQEVFLQNVDNQVINDNQKLVDSMQKWVKDVLKKRGAHIVNGIQNCNKFKYCEIDFPFFVSGYSNSTFRRVSEIKQ